MLIDNYGVKLKRLNYEKIELVRQWRNDPSISKYMDYTEHITSEMQKKWFDKINNENNYYFIIEYQEKDIGLINIKDIDHDKKNGEGGIFIYNKSYLNSDVSFRASLCLEEFVFDTLKLDCLNAHILSTNKRAIQFNKLKGYKLKDGQEGKVNQFYTLSKEDFYKHKKRIIQLIH